MAAIMFVWGPQVTLHATESEAITYARASGAIRAFAYQTDQQGERIDWPRAAYRDGDHELHWKTEAQSRPVNALPRRARRPTLKI